MRKEAFCLLSIGERRITISKYYGTLTSDKGTSTRAGHKYMSASAQTHEGSVMVEISDGVVTIRANNFSSNTGWKLLVEPLEKLLQADVLVIKRGRRSA